MKISFINVLRPVGMALVALSFAPWAQAVVVQANTSTPTLLGTVVGGQSYSLTASGIADLLAGFNGGLGLTFTADGKPTYAFPSPYAAFYPDGLDYDPSAGPGSFGVGGPGRLLGALLGTYTASPSLPSDFFVIGLGTTVTPALSGSIYGLVNDTYYPDNGSGGFSVILTAVPEPASYGLMLAGLGALVVALRRRKTA